MAKTKSYNSNEPYVILVGLDSIQGLQAARIYARHRVPLIAVASNPDFYACKTKVCEEILYVDTGTEDLIDLLVEIRPRFNHKPLLIPCLDKNVLTLSKYRKRLETDYHLMLPRHEVVEMLMDKVQFYTFAQEHGLPIPDTYFIYSRADAKEAARKIEYPCVLKPPFRPAEWTQNTSKKALYVADKEQFLALYDHYGRWADVLIAQGWIEGADSNLYSCNVYFNADSQPLATFIARKLRQWPPETGQSSLGEEIRADEVLEASIRLFEIVGYCGLGYLEMKLDDVTGKYFMVEPNVGRPTGRSAIAEAGQVEILYTMYCDVYGLPLPENREQKYMGVKWIHFLRDVRSAFYYWKRGNLTIREYWQSLQGPKAFAVFSWDDPGPFAAALFKTIVVLFTSNEEGI